jgi:transposase InsO family protein
MTLIAQALVAGARLSAACACIGLSARTLQRWSELLAQAKAQAPIEARLDTLVTASIDVPLEVQIDTPCELLAQPHVAEVPTPAPKKILPCGDRRVRGLRTPHAPKNKLSAHERTQLLCLLNSDEYKDLPPSQMAHRRLERVPQNRTKPRALKATKPNEVYCWDITYLPTQVRGKFFYLYLYVDLFSRFIVGWQVFECESQELGAELVKDICLRHHVQPGQLTLHSDNGGPMKGEIMVATLQRLGVAHTRSRPAVSNDNPYSEALFRTLKYRPEMPVEHFATVCHARAWVERLVHWYNEEHRHSKVTFVTPAQRHAGLDAQLLEGRKKVYECARAAQPQRWSKHTRRWEFVTDVDLNPDAKKEVQKARRARLFGETCQGQKP